MARSIRHRNGIPGCLYYVLPVTFLLLAAAWAGWTLSCLASYERAAGTVQESGTVVRRNKVGTERETITYKVSFSTPDGRGGSFTPTGVGLPGFGDAGDAVTVRYPPANPDGGYRSTFVFNWLPAILLGVPAVGLLLVVRRSRWRPDSEPDWSDEEIESRRKRTRRRARRARPRDPGDADA